MIPVAIALALGFIIGDHIRNLSRAILACVGVSALLSCAFLLLPYAWNRAPLHIVQAFEPLLMETVGFCVPALIGLFIGRRRKLKGWGR